MRFFFLAVMLCCFIQCKKGHIPLNIVLYDKPLGVIQSYIQGSWKLEYEKGGICGCIFPAKDSFFLYAILKPERIIFKNAFSVTVDTTINWIYHNATSDSTWVMNWYDRSGIPYNFGAREIRNDTLVLYQPGPDGVYFYYSQWN